MDSCAAIGNFFGGQSSASTLLPTTRELAATINRQQENLKEQEVAQKKSLQRIQRQEDEIKELIHQQTELKAFIRTKINNQKQRHDEVRKEIEDIDERIRQSNTARRPRLSAEITVSR